MTCLLIPTGERRTKETFHQSEMKLVPSLLVRAHTGDSTHIAFGVDSSPELLSINAKRAFFLLFFQRKVIN